MLFSSQDFIFTYILYHRSYNPSDFTSLFVSSICSSAFSLIIESVVLVSSLTVLWQALTLQAIHITPANSNPLYRLILKQYIFSYQQIHFITNILYKKYLCTKRPTNVQISTFTDRSFIYNPLFCPYLFFYTTKKPENLDFT